MGLHLIRHGPKNNNPDAHGTGVEALLDPAQIFKVLKYAVNSLECMHDQGIEKAVVETTPVPRAYVTGKLITAVFSLDPHFKATECSVDELIGSYDINSANGEAINLSPAAMSKVWADAKKAEKYGHLQGEHKPLYAWCEQGFDNQQANNPEDSGISLREIACRIGTYVHKKIQRKKEKVSTIAIGHSGDIEPFLYLCLEMLEGRDGTSADAMTKYFQQTGGALEPLQGLHFFYDGGNLKMEFPSPVDGLEGSSVLTDYRHIGEEFFQQQAQWFKDYGRSRQVIEQKIKAGK